MTQAELEQMFVDGDITPTQFSMMSNILATLERIVYPPTEPVPLTPIRDRVDQVSDTEFYTLYNDGADAWREYMISTFGVPDDFAVATIPPEETVDDPA
jgi:hypothetical protein